MKQSFFLSFFFCCICLFVNAREIEDPALGKVQHYKNPNYAIHAMLLGVAKAGNRIVVVGERGHILYSDDQGKKWTQADVPLNLTLTDVFFVDDKTGWAIGYDAAILKTIDAGETWQVQYFDPERDLPLLAISATQSSNPETDTYHLQAIGAYGLFLESMDSGKTWVEKMISVDENHLNAITSNPNGHSVISGEFGYIYIKDTKFGTWREIKTPYEGSFFGIFETKKHTLFAYGLRGHIFVSYDNGLTWKNIYSSTNMSLFGGTMLQDGRMAFVGASGVFLISEDATNTRFMQYRFPDRKTNSALVQLDEDSFLIVGQNGVRIFDLKSKVTPHD